jgi:rieske iron-sulfur protein
MTPRRTILKTGLGLGLGFIAKAADADASARPNVDDLLVKTNDTSGTPLTPADIPAGRQMMVWAMDPASKTVRNGSRFNRILLVKLDPKQLTPQTQSRAVDGIVAYSAVCTHAGCEVTDWKPDSQLLFCACHESEFDPKDGAKVIDGPAARELPALALKLSDGKLAVAKPFTATITFDTQ